MNNNPIGLFDSGIGGATVLKEILKVLPDENYIYYSDSINNPYGDKTNEEIWECCDKITDFLIEKKCKAIILACNTATAKTIDGLREKHKDKILVGIEPAYKMVYDYAYEKPTLVMATAGTLESEKFKKLYEKYNNNNTYLLPCKGLADIIEKGSIPDIKLYLRENLMKYKGKVQNVVLGCTHYELVKDEITNILGEVNFFNGTKGVANHLRNLLTQKDMLNKTADKKEIIFIDSANSEYKKKRFYEFLSIEVEQPS